MRDFFTKTAFKHALSPESARFSKTLANFRKRGYHINMYKNLRILFCILAVACAAATVFIFVFFNLWGFLPLELGIAFAALMFVCKRAQENEEAGLNPPPAKGDFITGKTSDKDE